jgi:D-alanine-D-alanine ligase
VLASAAGMDKIVMKQLFERAGLVVTRYEWFIRRDWERDADAVLKRIGRRLGYPVFVKPANLGSSVGISKAKNRAELAVSIELAQRYDRRIIVERAVVGREIEVSVLGADDPIASVPGEIVPGHEFYDYEDKYLEDKARTIVPADLPPRTVERLQRDAVTAFRAIDGAGLARVDFFIEGRSRIVTNEINTMPGFTSISMYPKMWEASGISYSELIDRLITLALERHRDKSRNVTIYKPDSK